MRTMKTILIGAAMLALVAVGCDSPPKSGRGFRLPDGNVEKGKATFVALQCYVCHKVDGVELPPPSITVSSPVLLGGEVARIKTYGELVTSVINPSHKLSPQMKKDWEHESKISPMPQFNDTMTVTQVIDLVAFLQSRYTKLEMEYQAYP